MQNTALGRIIAVAVLAFAALAVYLPQLRADSADTAVYLADVDYWQATKRRQIVTARMPIDMTQGLDSVPLTLGNWRGEDVPQTNLEVFILLEPEQFVQRRYRDDAGHQLWLTLIGSHKTRSFHPPDLCYDADGWQTDLASREIALSDGSVWGLWLSAVKDEAEHRVFYFYLMPPDDPTGVTLVRITSPPYGTDEETLAVQGDFLRQLLKRAQ